jgi:hypothetical protein
MKQFIPSLNRTVKAINASLTPELLSPAWAAKVKTGDHPLKGYCYVATEALYYLFGKKYGFKPHVVRINNGTHWFLRNGFLILDPTAAQFGNWQSIPYNLGHHNPFLSPKPSKRATTLIKRARSIA